MPAAGGVDPDGPRLDDLLRAPEHLVELEKLSSILTAMKHPCAWPCLACGGLLLLSSPGLRLLVADVRPFGAERSAEVSVSYDGASNVYRLSSEGDDSVTYALDLDDADLASGILRAEASIGGRTPVTVLAGAGTRFRSSAGVVHPPEEVAPRASAQLVEHRIEGLSVVLRYTEQPESHRLEKTYRLFLEGISLVVEISSDSTWGLDGYAGVSLGHAEHVSGAIVVYLPYMPEPVALLPDGTVMTAYVDPTVSSSVAIIELEEFIAAAREAGMLVGLHENYTDMYPNNPPDYPSPLWDASAIALDRDGRRKLGFYQPVTGQQAFRVAAHRMRDFADMESPRIASDYGPNAAYLDVTTAAPPGGAIDHNASSGAIPSLAYAYSAAIELFEAMKDLYGGPLLGEGGEGAHRFDTYYAGFVDAVERQTEGRDRAWVAPVYELLAVKPRMFNHGMGYYSRYFADSWQEVPTLEEVDLDQYRASEIAFGHAGFLGDGISGVDCWLRLHGAGASRSTRPWRCVTWVIERTAPMRENRSGVWTYVDCGISVDRPDFPQISLLKRHQASISRRPK